MVSDKCCDCDSQGARPWLPGGNVLCDSCAAKAYLEQPYARTLLELSKSLPSAIHAV